MKNENQPKPTPTPQNPPQRIPDHVPLRKDSPTRSIPRVPPPPPAKK